MPDYSDANKKAKAIGLGARNQDPVKRVKEMAGEAGSAIGKLFGGSPSSGSSKKTAATKASSGSTKKTASAGKSKDYSIDGKKYSFTGDKKPSKAQMASAVAKNKKKKKSS